MSTDAETKSTPLSLSLASFGATQPMSTGFDMTSLSTALSTIPTISEDTPLVPPEIKGSHVKAHQVILSSVHVDKGTTRDVKVTDSKTGALNNITMGSCQVSYNFGTIKEIKLKPALMELPKVTFRGGIVSKRTANGVEKSMYIPLPPDHPASAIVIKAFETFRQAGINHLRDNEFGKSNLPLAKFNKDGDNFTSPVFYPKDKSTGIRIAGKTPGLYPRLDTSQQSPTVFKGLDKVVIPWDDLLRVDGDFIPMVRIDAVKSSPNSQSIKYTLTSAIVTDIRIISTIDQQTDTIDTHGGLDPAKVAEFKEKMAKIKKERAENPIKEEDTFRKEAPAATSTTPGGTSSQGPPALPYNQGGQPALTYNQPGQYQQDPRYAQMYPPQSVTSMMSGMPMYGVPTPFGSQIVPQTPMPQTGFAQSGFSAPPTGYPSTGFPPPTGTGVIAPTTGTGR